MNRFIIKLKQWLHYNNFKGNFHFTIIVIILAFLFITTREIEKIFIGCLMLGLLIYIFIKHRHLFFLSAIITFSIISIYFIKVLLYDNAKEKLNQNLIVKEVEEEETYQKVIFSNGYYKYIYYNKNNFILQHFTSNIILKKQPLRTFIKVVLISTGAHIGIRTLE